MYFADYGITCHSSEAAGDLTGAQSLGPQFLEQLHALVGPGHACCSLQNYVKSVRRRTETTSGRATHERRRASVCVCMGTQLDRLPTQYWKDLEQLVRVVTTTRNDRLGGVTTRRTFYDVTQPYSTARYRGLTTNTYNIQFWVYKDRATLSRPLTGTRCRRATDRVDCLVSKDERCARQIEAQALALTAIS